MLDACRAELAFLSTPSARRATWASTSFRSQSLISIHALREEGDGDTLNNEEAKGYFYPRPPRGGRLVHALAVVQLMHISIHALREEGDHGCSTPFH